MRAAALLIGSAALLCSVSAATPPPPATAMPSWMSGDWVAEKGDSWTEERWSRPRGGVMLGTSLSGRGDRAGDYEFIRLAADADGRLTYFAAPMGARPVAFRMTSAGREEVVFENPSHDYPTRIHYRRSGSRMVATIAGRGGANPASWHYRRR